MSRAVFSPDGGKIAFEWTLDPGPNATSSIYWYDLELGGPTQLTFNGLRDMEPVWSPDGSRIAFARADESARGAPARIFVKDFGGTETATPLLEVEGQNYPTDWTADGTITFETSSRAGDLYTMPADGGEPTPYLEAEWSESGLAVAPDGQWAAYVSDERIREGFGGEIFVRRFPEATAQARVSDGPGYSPQWSPDGRTLYYLTQGQPDQVIAARVQLEPSFLVLERAVVWEGQAFGLDAHPSEDKLLVIELLPGGSDAEEIETRFYVVVNWFEELRARLGEGN
jgi:Tol biopolymer transport system component